MKRFISTALSLIMLLSLAVPVMAAPDAKKAPAWIVEGFAGAKAKSSAIANVPGVPWNRGNASGDKISSNAHSMDFDGIYFEWDEKQKDPGVLLVREDVFDLFVGETFKITAKNSNSYYGYQLSKSQTENIVSYTYDGLAVYGYVIPKQAKNDKGKSEDLKNINMVFIDGMYKDAYIEITKDWLDWQGNPIDKPKDVANATFGKYPSVGTYPVKITSWGGTNVTVTEDLITGFDTFVNGKSGRSVTLAVRANQTVRAAFENKERPATITISKNWVSDDLDFVSDDSQVSFTGGWALGTVTVAPGTVVDFYEEEISGFDFSSVSVNSEISYINKVDFTAVRSSIYSIVFTNIEKITPKGTLKLEKRADGSHISLWMHDNEVLNISEYIEGFNLYNVVGGEIVGDAIDFCEIDASGEIIFEEVEQGWYAIVEALTDLGKDFFEEAAPLIFYFDGNNIVGGGNVAYVSGPSYGTVVSHDGTGVDHVLPNVWNNALAGQPVYDKLIELGARWIWDVEDTYIYGVNGSVFESRFTVDMEEDLTVPFYFASDNAAVVYVNGKLAGYTTVALRNSLEIGEAYDAEVFAFLNSENFDGRWTEGWTHSYEILINLNSGENEIIVVAANSRRTENTGTPNDEYDETNNPCGVIFGFEAPGKTVFENRTKEIIDPKFTISLEKWVEGLHITEWMYDNSVLNIREYIAGFELYNTAAGEIVGDAINFCEIDAAGEILFEDIQAGSYAIVEVLTAKGGEVFYLAEPMFFDIVDRDADGVFENFLKPVYVYPDVDKIPSDSHIARWSNYGIYCLAGNTTPDGMYFVAFDTDFFDTYKSVDIRYGTPNGKTVHDLTLTKGDCEFGTITYNGITYSGWIYKFYNPSGSGSMQAHLERLQLAKFNGAGAIPFFTPFAVELPFDLVDLHIDGGDEGDVFVEDGIADGKEEVDLHVDKGSIADDKEEVDLHVDEGSIADGKEEVDLHVNEDEIADGKEEIDLNDDEGLAFGKEEVGLIVNEDGLAVGQDEAETEE